ncbi:MAG TPA: zf-HC2 domain-containing protein [Longimicrobiales bacterium]|nr:zf-HC2 domain-containing protein [Longimicrobiales bacterium]
MHLTEIQINDFADGSLTADELRLAQQHVQACSECRAEVDALRALVLNVNSLPRSIEPARDLRPQIWTQVDRRSLWSWRYQLAAAAVVLIAISSIVTATIVGGRENEPVDVAGIDQTVAVDLVGLERQYSTEVEDLQRVLRRNREQLAPETVRIVEENLAIIDAAIREARAALEQDPQSAMLGELLRSAYQRKLDLLKQAARSSATT